MQNNQNMLIKTFTDVEELGVDQDAYLYNIETRFGVIRINTSKTISFKQGLLGMPDKINFCLANFPSDKFARFKILQSLDDERLAFIVLPYVQYQSDLPIIEQEDLNDVYNTLNSQNNNIAILFITSIHRGGELIENGTVRISINARAPLVIDADTKNAIQHVFVRDKYSIQHFLN
jgi:flagellar assembly factor FliW